MKTILLSATCTVAAIMLYCNNAIAETINVDVRAGRTTEIYWYAVFNRANCASTQRPKLSVKSVKNGKVTPKNRSAPLNSGNCKGRKVNATAALYTPNPGFRGKDTVKISYRFDKYLEDNSGFRWHHVTINVAVK